MINVFWPQNNHDVWNSIKAEAIVAMDNAVDINSSNALKNDRLGIRHLMKDDVERQGREAKTSKLKRLMEHIIGHKYHDFNDQGSCTTIPYFVGMGIIALTASVEVLQPRYQDEA